MSKQSNTTFYELCRLCLESPGVKAITDVDALPEDILCYIGVKVTVSDNLPQKICKSCLRTLKKVKKLKELATTNDAHLKFLFDDEEKTSNCSSSTNMIQAAEAQPKINEFEVINNNDLYSVSISEACSTQTQPAVPLIRIRKDLLAHNSEEDINHLHINKVKRRPIRDVMNEMLDDDDDDDNKPHKKKVKDEPSLGNEIYPCSICKKNFNVRRKLYHHQRLHNKTVMCPFDTCLKKFASKNDLAKHVRTHTGEKPYKCSFCDKSFTQKITMTQHELSHYRAGKVEKANY